MIVFEGIDGSGKATQAEKLYHYLSHFRNISGVKKMSFPDYNSEIGKLLKGCLNGEHVLPTNALSMLFTLDRVLQFTDKNDDFGLDERDSPKTSFLICDRYATSNLVHQLSRLSPDCWDEYIEHQQKIEYEWFGLPQPSLVIYLDMNPVIAHELMIKRMEKRGEVLDNNESDLEYQMRCRDAAYYCAGKLGWKILTCDNGKEPYLQATIAMGVQKIVDNKFAL